MAFDKTWAWLRGGAGPMKDRRMKRTGRGSDERAAIEEQMAVCDPDVPEANCPTCGGSASGEYVFEKVREAADAEGLRCVVCQRQFTRLSGNTFGCPAHGLVTGVRRLSGRSIEYETTEEYSARTRLPEGWIQGTAEELLDLPEGEIDKVAKYRAGEYQSPAPDSDRFYLDRWTEADWIVWIDARGEWL